MFSHRLVFINSTQLAGERRMEAETGRFSPAREKVCFLLFRFCTFPHRIFDNCFEQKKCGVNPTRILQVVEEGSSVAIFRNFQVNSTRKNILRKLPIVTFVFRLSVDLCFCSLAKSSIKLVHCLSSDGMSD